MKNLSEEELNDHIESLITEITKKPENLSAEFIDYWRQICSKQYDFNRCELFSCFATGLSHLP